MTVDCSSVIYNIFLFPIKNIMNLVMIISPILLIISLLILFTKMVANPDEKKTIKKIFNSFKALIFIFFVSCIVNASMYLLGNSFSVTECWNNANKVNLSEQYIDPYEKKKNKVNITESEFEKGEERKDDSSSNINNDGNLNTNSNDRVVNARNAAVNWAINIANDNSFHYGHGSWIHHGGCYFCDNGYQKTKVKAGATVEESAKTYTCNTLISAAYYHGAGSKKIKCHGGLLNSIDGGGIKNSLKSELSKVSKPSKITDCLPGDIFLSTGHVSMYVGDGKIVESVSAYDDGVFKSSGWNKSIAVRKMSTSRYNGVIEVWRFTSTGKF